MGPLSGVRVVEVAGIGPGPFCAMLLADMGADVLRIERSHGARLISDGNPVEVLNRGRPAIALDLKNSAAVAAVLELCSGADALLEGFRPGVMERLGLGPQTCLLRNPKLIYGRMTGWGQTGPRARQVGHDINYLAVSGMLHMFAREGERPVPPANLVADMGGGGLLLAFGMVCALLEARTSGKGQIVDAAMVEGASLLGASLYTHIASGVWNAERAGVNIADTGAHFYEVYETRDRKFGAVGAIEPQFYAQLVTRMGLDISRLPQQMDRSTWPEMKRMFSDIFRTKTRGEWEEIFANSDACFSSVLSPHEAFEDEHMKARGAFSDSNGVRQPAPAPRLSRTPGRIQEREGPADAAAVLTSWGVSPACIAQLDADGAMG